ncbi:hypothetical protein LCGC14_0371880 [marine sediment metagenome]|uniref:Uncharacterized protein n=1 Tax=marine sediment metagenome TaxID=412755 RepID=A0A0F9VSA5_9ZZZZ
MNKTETIQWLVGHIFDAHPNPDFAIDDLWIILSTLIEFLEREKNDRIRADVMYNIRSMLKGVVYAESPTPP